MCEPCVAPLLDECQAIQRIDRHALAMSSYSEAVKCQVCSSMMERKTSFFLAKLPLYDPASARHLAAVIRPCLKTFL